MAEEKKNDLVFIGGLWKNQAKDGRDYFSGSFGLGRLLIFEVKERKSEKHPTHSMYVAPGKPKGETSGGSGSSSDESTPF